MARKIRKDDKRDRYERHMAEQRRREAADRLAQPVDSKEGIAALIEWAKAGGYVLGEAHEEIAKRYGVSTEGVTIARYTPR